MARTFPPTLAGLLFTAIPVVLLSAPPEQPERPVRTHQLHALESSGKVDVVLWTRRADGYTLQVVMPRQRRKGPYPRIGAWLVRADGQRIEPAKRWDSPGIEKCPYCVGAEASFTFQAADGAAATVAVITIDEVPRHAALPRFED